MSQRSSSNLIMIHIITKSNLLCGRNNHFRETLAPAGVRHNLETSKTDRRKWVREKETETGDCCTLHREQRARNGFLYCKGLENEWIFKPHVERVSITLQLCILQDWKITFDTHLILFDYRNTAVFSSRLHLQQRTVNKSLAASRCLQMSWIHHSNTQRAR